MTSTGRSAITGYRHPLYATSLSEFGSPLWLPGCEGSVLRRTFPLTGYQDAMGCYPLFCCGDWARLATDLRNIDPSLVSLSLVSDPFIDMSRDGLSRIFQRVAPFKRHFVLDLAGPACISKHHRYYARRALREIQVDVASDRLSHLDEWAELYCNLVHRHQLKGIKAFSRKAFELQLQIPGAVLLRARKDDRTLAAHLWYVQGDVAQSHLLAMSEEGYRMNASYGLYWEAIQKAAGIFGPAVRWLNLGAGAGLDAEGLDGLTRFKRGWTALTRPAFFCGHILDEDKYAACAAAAGYPQTSYFPAYRQGEFT